MRIKLSKVFIDLNHQLLINNPVGKLPFMTLLLLQTLIIFLFPYFIFLYIGAYTSPIRYLYELQKDRWPITLFNIVCLSVQIVNLGLYLCMLTYTYFMRSIG